jgi:hypothetical protein
MSAKNNRHADPMKTRTGKTRLGPLNHRQLTDMLTKAKPKDRSKIQNRIDILVKKTGYRAPELVAEAE